MIQGLDLRYTITTQAATTVLAYAPKGWEEGLIKWVRSEKYWGMFRSFSIPMQFYKDGKDILCAVYASEGSEGYAEILIERIDRSTGLYKTYFKAVADFTQFKWTDLYCEVNLIEGGISKKIKDLEAIKYDILKPTGTPITWTDVKFVSGGLYTIQVIDLEQVLTRLLHHMTGGWVGVESELLDDYTASNSHFYLINGRGIRTGQAGNMQMSFADLFQALNAAFCMGCGVESTIGGDILRLDSRAYFLQNTEILAATINASETTIAPAKQFLANKMKYGFSTWDPQSQNNDPVANRFSKECECSIPTITSKGEVAASSDFFADGEYMTYLYGLDGGAGSIYEDVSGDNDIFILHVKHDGGQKYMWEGTCMGVAGAKNTYLGSKQMLINWKSYLESITKGIVNTNIDPYLITVLPHGWTGIHSRSDYTGNTLYEDEIVSLTGDGNIFSPYIFTIKTKGTVDISDILEANHHGYISFNYKGVTLKGHIMEVSANPTRRKVLDLTLLAHKDTDLSQIL